MVELAGRDPRITLRARVIVMGLLILLGAGLGAAWASPPPSGPAQVAAFDAATAARLLRLADDLRVVIDSVDGSKSVEKKLLKGVDKFLRKLDKPRSRGACDALDAITRFVQGKRGLRHLTAAEAASVLAKIAELRLVACSTPDLPVVDDAAATSAVVGPEGGTLVTERGAVRYTFSIPPGAVATPVAIRVTPVVTLPNLPFSGGVEAAVRFEPDGLQLLLPARLTIDVGRALDPQGLVGFQLEGDGTNLEVHTVAVTGTSIALPVKHFSFGGAATWTLADFVAQMTPLLDALPPVASIPQAESLVSLLATWIGDPPRHGFGFDVCSQTNLCQRVLDVAERSFVAHQAQTAAQAAAFVAQGEPFLAHHSLSAVADMAGRLFVVRVIAEAAGVPGFEVTFLDLTALSAEYPPIIALARQQALANIRPGLLHLLIDIAARASALSLASIESQAIAALTDVAEGILDQARHYCAQSDPDAGEFVIDQILGTLTRNFLNALEPTLADRLQAARTGCRVHMLPSSLTLAMGEQAPLTGTTIGLVPAGVSWSLVGPALGSTIDPQSGVVTAGQTTGTITVQATSVADPSLFARIAVTIIVRSVTVSPATPTVAAGSATAFSAATTGLANPAVTWSVTGGGIIDQAGMFTAGTIAGTFTVRATSVSHPGTFGEATVTVTVPPAVGLSGLLGSTLAFTNPNGYVHEVAIIVDAELGPGGVPVVSTFFGQCTTTYNSNGAVVTEDVATAIFEGTPADPTMNQELYLTTSCGGSMIGRIVRSGGRIVEIDFTFREVYDFGSYSQFGALR